MQEKVDQLKFGLANSQQNLGSALAECNSNAACASFLEEFNLKSDLALGRLGGSKYSIATPDRHPPPWFLPFFVG